MRSWARQRSRFGGPEALPGMAAPAYLRPMKKALDMLEAFLDDDYQGKAVLGEQGNELTVWHGGQCVAVVPLTLAEFACLLRVLPVPQRLLPIQDFHRALLLAPNAPNGSATMQLLASYPFLNLYLHPGPPPALEAQWHGSTSSTLLRQATVECVTFAREHRVTGWIADDRQLEPLRPRDLNWIATYALPLLVKWGVRRFAHLEAANPLTQRGLDPVQESAGQHLSFEIRSFTDLAAARAWACGQAQ